MLKMGLLFWKEKKKTFQSWIPEEKRKKKINKDKLSSECEGEGEAIKC